MKKKIVITILILFFSFTLYAKLTARKTNIVSKQTIQDKIDSIKKSTTTVGEK